jgi:hypothetical protein
LVLLEYELGLNQTPQANSLYDKQFRIDIY